MNEKTPVVLVIDDLMNTMISFDTQKEAEQYVASHEGVFRIAQGHRSAGGLLYGPIQEDGWTWGK